MITVVPSYSFLRELLREDSVREVGVVCTVHSETNSDKVNSEMDAFIDEDIVSTTALLVCYCRRGSSSSQFGPFFAVSALPM